jgi:hypothetical protein
MQNTMLPHSLMTLIVTTFQSRMVNPYAIPATGPMMGETSMLAMMVATELDTRTKVANMDATRMSVLKLNDKVESSTNRSCTTLIRSICANPTCANSRSSCRRTKAAHSSRLRFSKKAGKEEVAGSVALLPVTDVDEGSDEEDEQDPSFALSSAPLRFDFGVVVSRPSSMSASSTAPEEEEDERFAMVVVFVSWLLVGTMKQGVR